ncbi:cilia- and flagella-associated protein 251 isoform X2 [Brachypodium distachyon]|uniref:cilia- and flagella-associated protein 251 isoform X2 n=1 Tax=Brachypodium distachyon TaxID=15368 RepID=UPI000D0DDBC4|nr:cilia- and flagella-associated protein 251 isoform X2 [Brachypodium distachyon]|eukprot:XP_024312987.1 cilia- and flagella-associated protein 251 isoform X2 [Brachypodium distachyon]
MCPEALSSAAKPKRAKRKRPEADLMRHRGGHCFKRPRRAVEEEWDEELPFVVKRRSRRPNPPTHRAPNLCPEALSPVAKPRRSKRKRLEADLKRHGGGERSKRPRRMGTEEKLPIVVKWRTREEKESAGGVPEAEEEKKVEIGQQVASESQPAPDDEKGQHPKEYSYILYLEKEEEEHMRVQKEYIMDLEKEEEEHKRVQKVIYSSAYEEVASNKSGSMPKELCENVMGKLDKQEYIMALEKEEEEHKRVQKVIYSSAYEEVASNKSGSMPKELCENVMGKLDKQEYIMDLEKEEEEHKRVQKVIYSSAYEEVASNKSSSMPKELFENVMGKLDKQEYIMALEKEEEEHKRVQKIKDSSAYMAVASNRFGSMPKELFENMEEKVDKQHPTQIFVDIFGSHVSMQEDLGKVSVKSLIQTAFRRVGVNTNNFYSTCSGKYLDEDRILSHCQILKDSTIKVSSPTQGWQDPDI